MTASQISPTALSRFRECPARYRYSKEKSMPTIITDTEALERGSKFHDQFIRSYFQAIPDYPNETQVQLTAEQIFKQTFGSTPDDDEHKLLIHFIKFEQSRLRTAKTYKPEMMETTFRTDNYNCRIDFYWNNTIIDWKTSKTDRLDEDMMRQGAINKLASHEHGVIVDKVVFVLLWSGKTLEIPYIPEPWIQGQISELRQAERLDIWPTKRSKNCKFCPYLLRCFGEGRSLWS
jgi:hypothetical protein